MNQTSAAGTFAPLVAFLAGLLAGKGVFGLDAATWATVIGSIFAFGATIWGIVTSRKNAQIAAVAALPEVQSIKLEPTASQDTLAATPANVTK